MNPSAAFFESILRAETPILTQCCGLAPSKTFIDSIDPKRTLGRGFALHARRSFWLAADKGGSEISFGLRNRRGEGSELDLISTTLRRAMSASLTALAGDRMLPVAVCFARQQIPAWLGYRVFSGISESEMAAVGTKRTFTRLARTSAFGPERTFRAECSAIRPLA